jgi:hypothetical protein
MKKLFLLITLFWFGFSICNAQDTIACRNGKKIVAKVVSIGKQKVIYMVLPDSTQKVISSWRVDYISYPGGTRFNMTADKKYNTKSSTTELYLSADYGFTVPAISYKDGIVGTYFGARATYYFHNHIGLTLKAGVDLNGTGLNYISSSYWGGFYIFQQYLGGITYRMGGKPGYPWVDIVGLGGLAAATNPVSETGNGNNGITVNTPGNGKGFGYYIGLDFTSSANHLCSLTFGVGCFGSVFSYPDYSSTYSKYDTYSNSTSTTVSKSNPKMSLELPQMYFAINFRAKKATR